VPHGLCGIGAGVKMITGAAVVHGEAGATVVHGEAGATVVVGQGVVVGCKQHCSVVQVPWHWRLYACGRLTHAPGPTHAAGQAKFAQFGGVVAGATVVVIIVVAGATVVVIVVVAGATVVVIIVVAGATVVVIVVVAGATVVVIIVVAAGVVGGAVVVASGSHKAIETCHAPPVQSA